MSIFIPKGELTELDVVGPVITSKLMRRGSHTFFGSYLYSGFRGTQDNVITIEKYEANTGNMVLRFVVNVQDSSSNEIVPYVSSSAIYIVIGGTIAVCDHYGSTIYTHKLSGTPTHVVLRSGYCYALRGTTVTRFGPVTGQIDTFTLPTAGSNKWTAIWGCGIVGESSKLFGHRSGGSLVEFDIDMNIISTGDVGYNWEDVRISHDVSGNGVGGMDNETRVDGVTPPIQFRNYTGTAPTGDPVYWYTSDEEKPVDIRNIWNTPDGIFARYRWQSAGNVNNEKLIKLNSDFSKDITYPINTEYLTYSHWSPDTTAHCPPIGTHDSNYILDVVEYIESSSPAGGYKIVLQIIDPTAKLEAPYTEASKMQGHLHTYNDTQVEWDQFAGDPLPSIADTEQQGGVPYRWTLSVMSAKRYLLNPNEVNEYKYQIILPNGEVLESNAVTQSSDGTYKAKICNFYHWTTTTEQIVLYQNKGITTSSYGTDNVVAAQYSTDGKQWHDITPVQPEHTTVHIPLVELPNKLMADLYIRLFSEYGLTNTVCLKNIQGTGPDSGPTEETKYLYTKDDKVYTVVNGQLSSINKLLNTVTDTDFINHGTETPNLKVVSSNQPIKVMCWVDKATATSIPVTVEGFWKPQTIVCDFDLTVEGYKSLQITGDFSAQDIVTVALSTDQGRTWKTYSEEHSSWVAITEDKLFSDGCSYKVINKLNESKLEQLLRGKNKVRLMYSIYRGNTYTVTAIDHTHLRY